MPSQTVNRTAWWQAPLVADTWRRTLYILLAVPVSLAALGLALVGRAAAAARLQRRLADRLLEPRLDGDTAVGRPIRHALASLPLNLAALVVTGYLWVGVPMNLLYPLRPGSESTDWGGPSLAGRWAVHALGGLVMLYAVCWAVRGLTRLQARLVRRYLG